MSDRPPRNGVSKKWNWRGTLSPPEFPRRNVNGQDLADDRYAEKLRDFAAAWVQFYVQYYDRRNSRCRTLAIALRAVAFAAMVLGSGILVARLLSVAGQTWVMTTLFAQDKLTEIPAEIGLVLFAVAAALMAIDKFANISENWMRYVIAKMSLERSLVEFQMAGVRAQGVPTPGTEPDGKGPPANPAQLEFARIKAFLDATFDLVQHETQEWANEFRKNQSDLESYLKLQSEAKAQPKPP